MELDLKQISRLWRRAAIGYKRFKVFAIDRDFYNDYRGELKEMHRTLTRIRKDLLEDYPAETRAVIFRDHRGNLKDICEDLKSMTCEIFFY